MKKLKLAAAAGILALIIGACSESKNAVTAPPNNDESREATGITNGVMKAKGVVPVIVDGQGQIHLNARAEVPVVIVNPSAVRFNISTADMTTPPISNAMLSLGSLKISELFDNNLKVCGANGRTKCSKAYIQIYTIGTPGSGVYNVDGDYGMPFYANMPNTTPLTIGLDVANAAVVQLVNIPMNKRVLRLSDFTTPTYELTTDFTEAGAGSYETTAVIEYGLLD